MSFFRRLKNVLKDPLNFCDTFTFCDYCDKIIHAWFGTKDGKRICIECADKELAEKNTDIITSPFIDD